MRRHPQPCDCVPVPPTCIAGAVNRQLASSRASALLAAGLIALTPELQARDVPFAPQAVVATSAYGAQSAAWADVDGDGDPDLLSASIQDDKIAWYENTGGDGSAWTPHTVTTSADGVRFVAWADIDRDSDPDLLSASFNDDKIAWYENTDGDGSAWTPHTVTTSADGANAVGWADIDRDGDPDLLSASRIDDMVAWHENTGGDGGAWTLHTVTTSADGARSVAWADIDRDGDPDLISASDNDDKIAWYENADGRGGAWKPYTVTTSANGANTVAWADIDRDGDPDLLSASLNDDKIAWYENTAGDGSAWTPHTVTTSATGADSVAWADMDADGDPDLLSASRYDNRVAWYENASGDGSAWTPHTVTTLATGANAVGWADVDGDGDPDLFSASLYDNKIAWYENETIHRSGYFPTTHTVSDLPGGAFSVAWADLDGDGDPDLLSASFLNDRIAWYENDGSPWDGGWTSHTVTIGADSPRSVSWADVDGDGDADTLSASAFDNKIAWYENTLGDGSAWSTHTVTSSASFADSVAWADLDGDGDTDLLSASYLDDKVAWYENTLGDGSAWATHTVSTAAEGAQSVASADVDGDGDLDLLSASWYDNKIAWYENTDRDGSAWTLHTVTSLAHFAQSVASADVDGDGDPDLLSASTCTYCTGKVAWYENTAGNGTAWTTHVLPAADNRANSVAWGDIDGDGDVDLLSASFYDDKIVWYENTAGDGTAWTPHVVTSTADGALAVTPVDVDRDGDTDLLAASRLDSTVAWYENRGGQFALVSADTAPSTLPQGSADDLLKITMSHRGRSGDTDAELAGLELLFEHRPGEPLTGAEVDALIENLRIYADEGSGVFEPGSDSLAATFTSFTLDAGKEMFLLPDGSSHAQVLFGFPETFFVVPELTADAARQTPGSFRLTHLTAASSSAEDRDHDIPLTLEYAANLSASIVTATGDGSCSGTVISLESESLDGVTLTCTATVSITAGPAVTVTGGADVFFRAPLISLNPGFSVTASGTFRSGP